ncbi:MAG: hypothetical protein Q9200_006843 [Gallowayella weberi]
MTPESGNTHFAKSLIAIYYSNGETGNTPFMHQLSNIVIKVWGKWRTSLFLERYLPF